MDNTLFEFQLFGFDVVVTAWKLFGLMGVLLFTGRWFFQMYYSRKAGKPVTPRIFWVMSVMGSLILLSYFIFSPNHRDMVGILSNLFPCAIAAYNLYLDLTHEKKMAAAAAQADAMVAAE
jgi:lipid-A-disaccharide synthase-like uncharacterized protein